MPCRGRVHLLLEHALVRRADGVLGSPEDLRADERGLSERKLRHRTADPALDPLGAERDLVVTLAFAPLLRPVSVADRHPHDRDRRVNAAERHNAGNASPGADDHLAADLLAEDPVRRADVLRPSGVTVAAFRPSPCSRIAWAASCTTRSRSPPVLEREVEPWEIELDADHVRREDAQGLFEQLLPGFVPFEHHDRFVLARQRTLASRAMPMDEGGWRREGSRGRSATSTRAVTGSPTPASSSGSSRW